MHLNEMIDVDLPSLQSITLGHCSLNGILADSTNKLIMRSNHK